MKVIVTASLGQAQLQQRLADRIGDQAHWVESADATVSELPTADALICPDHFISAKIAEALKTSAPALKWVQLLTAGYDNFKRHGAPARITVCNAGEAYAPAVATHALTLLLALQRRIPTVLANQPRHAWERAFTAQLTIPAAGISAVIGFGPIGREIGRMLRALGSKVVAVTRRGLPDEQADEVVPASALHDVLPRVDAIMIAAPYDSSTHNLIGEREFALFRKSAVLVNIARGAIVDSQALDAA